MPNEDTASCAFVSLSKNPTELRLEPLTLDFSSVYLVQARVAYVDVDAFAFSNTRITVGARPPPVAAIAIAKLVTRQCSFSIDASNSYDPSHPSYVAGDSSATETTYGVDVSHLKFSWSCVPVPFGNGKCAR